MNDNQPSLLLYYGGILVGFLLGLFIMYMGYVKPNLLLPVESYTCIDAEPIDKDPSIVACTIILRKGSEPYKKFLEANHDQPI